MGIAQYTVYVWRVSFSPFFGRWNASCRFWCLEFRPTSSKPNHFQINPSIAPHLFSGIVYLKTLHHTKTSWVNGILHAFPDVTRLVFISCATPGWLLETAWLFSFAKLGQGNPLYTSVELFFLPARKRYPSRQKGLEIFKLFWFWMSFFLGCLFGFQPFWMLYESWKKTKHQSFLGGFIYVAPVAGSRAPQVPKNGEHSKTRIMGKPSKKVTILQESCWHFGWKNWCLWIKSLAMI